MPVVQLSFKPKAVSKKLLNSLNPRTREVITKRYGLEAKERKTLESIGREYGITRERVRQIENFALSTIRKSKDYAEAEAVFEELSSIVKNLGILVPEDVLMEHISNDEIALLGRLTDIIIGEYKTTEKVNIYISKLSLKISFIIPNQLFPQIFEKPF